VVATTGPVTLNVGGVRYTTSRSTCAGSPRLKELVSGPPGPDGAYFLDRDGRFFSEVLNFLRDGPELFVAPAEVDVRRALQREATFFELPALGKTVQDVYVGAPMPTNEKSRNDRLNGLGIMNTDEHEQHYDAITRIIAALMDVPTALISLVGDEYQWFKSRVGLEDNSTPRNTSFCAFTFTPEAPTCAMMTLVSDAKSDSRVCDNPLVIGAPFISFYAGCPLVTSDGFRLGALCAIDTVPRSISPLQAQFMVNFGQICTQEIEREQLTLEDDEELMFDAVPSNTDFAAGPLRAERMKEALQEAMCLVQVREGSFDWPIMWVNKVWTQFTGVRVVPPDRLPGKALAEEVIAANSSRGKVSLGRKRERKELGFLSWLQILGKNPDELREEIKFKWAQSEPIAFALKGTVLKVVEGMPGTRERCQVTCRFMPAELPLDAAAAAIRPVPQREAGSAPAMIGNVPGRFYFVTTVQSTEGGPQFTRQETSPYSTEDAAPSAGGLDDSRQCSQGSDSRKQRRGNSLDAVSAIKPPRSPFDDVRLLRIVGQGSFGKVFYGLWMGSPVAVKTIETRNKEQQRKFEPAFEAVLSASMSHPNLVQTFMSSSRNKPTAAEVEDEADQVLETWMVQEWCDRGTLGAHCSRPRTDQGSMTEVVDIGLDIAGAGSYLHSRGIIHGDLTANNVLLKTQVSRKGYVCKICDFGLARVLEGDTMDIMTTQLGTVTHMPPELFAVGQVAGLTTMADVYAAGVLYWQAVMGEPPFAGLSPPQVVVQIVKGKRLHLPPDVHQGLAEVVEEPHLRDALAALA